LRIGGRGEEYCNITIGGLGEEGGRSEKWGRGQNEI